MIFIDKLKGSGDDKELEISCSHIRTGNENIRRS